MKPYKSPYKDHGSRHAPGGTDPIPNLATGSGIKWAYMSAEPTGGFSIDTTGGTNSLNLNTSHFYTNDTSIFVAENLSPTGGPGSFGGLKILEGGVYRLSVAAAWSTLEAGQVGQVYYGHVDQGSGGVMSRTYLGGRNLVKGDDDFLPTFTNANESLISIGPTLFFQELLDVPGSATTLDGESGRDSTPIEFVFWAINGDGTATTTAKLATVGVLLEQFGTDAYSLLRGI